jgi:hypothetical protein
VKFVATKNGMTTNFFSPLSFVAVFGSEIRNLGSGIGKNQDPGSRINNPDPQHWFQIRNILVQILGFESLDSHI